MLRRTFRAVAFGGAVAVSQAIAMGGVFALIALAASLHRLLAVPVGVGGMLAALALVPAVVHSRFAVSRWAPATSMRATVFLAFGGWSAGDLLASVFLETGHLRGQSVESLAGAMVGSLALVTLGNLRVR
jgi:hypothetical protein